MLDTHFLRTPCPNTFILYVDKIGCTFVKHMIVDNLYGDIYMLDPSFFLEGWSHHGILHFLAGEAITVDGRSVLSQPDAKIITFCRNPYSRFVSAYFNKILSPNPTELDHHQWVRREIMSKLLKSGRYEGDLQSFAEGVTLRHFAEFVRDTPPSERDLHWTEQWHVNLEDLIPDRHLVRFESFDRDFEDAWRRLVGEWPTTTCKMQRNSSSRPRGVLNKSTADIIYEIYREDFVRFDYARDSWMDV